MPAYKIIADSAGESKDPGLIEPKDVDGILYPIDGIYTWPDSTLVKFQGKIKFPYTVFGNPEATVFDLEDGCCTVAEVAEGIKCRRSLGASSIVYCSISPWLSYYNELASLLRTGPVTHWWVADYRSSERPTVLPALSKRVRAVGLQWYDFGPYDLSLVDLDSIPPNTRY